eukprot:CAMPEP_0202919006 /NCGR_PEP_ID=MMETSP1392-20130828/74742_1 /ASSEMBLY_ACC=CAM_ASM_000868 /TAXON_ID=225041 /ORGANISM="Chlamydomonas chlamydogama, Strain SAG 11-48b" /LENGTH=46 /DNA_ID= /DNA_START= /DNA_END= /DNA_ORIENTATION=
MMAMAGTNHMATVHIVMFFLATQSMYCPSSSALGKYSAQARSRAAG